MLLELPDEDVAAAAPAGLGPGPAVELVLLELVEGQLDVTELAQHGAQGARGFLGKHMGLLFPRGTPRFSVCSALELSVVSSATSRASLRNSLE